MITIFIYPLALDEILKNKAPANLVDNGRFVEAITCNKVKPNPSCVSNCLKFLSEVLAVEAITDSARNLATVSKSDILLFSLLQLSSNKQNGSSLPLFDLVFILLSTFFIP